MSKMDAICPKLVLCVFVTMVNSAIVPRLLPCDSNQGNQGANSDPPLPELPDQFETRIEANIVQKNYSTEHTEYYDYTNNRGAIISHRIGREHHSIMHFQTLERITIFTHNNTCHVTNLTDSRFNIFNFTVGADGGHVKGVKDIFKFGSEFGETYIGGDERIRGVAVEHWQSCMKFEGRNGSFNLDYYFSQDFYNTSLGDKRIPIRAVLNGTGEGWHSNGSLHNFYHIYDFFSFRAGPIQDDSVFKVPVGVFCNGSVVQKEMPKLPDQFTTGMEVTHLHSIGDVSTADKSTEQVFFDYPSRLLRTDNLRPTSNEDFFRFGNSPMTLIHDYNSSLLYIIDKWEGNCTVRADNHTEPGRSDFGHNPTERTKHLFSIMSGEFVYQGKKNWRGFPVEAWAMFNESSLRLQEIFFQDPSAITEYAPGIGSVPATGSGQGEGQGKGPGLGSNPGPGPKPGSNQGTRPGMGQGPMRGPPQVPQAIVGIFERAIEDGPRGKENLTSYTDFFGFTPGHIEANAFDVTPCYEEGHHYVYMSVRIEGSYKADVIHSQMQFYASAREALARGANVSTTRITALSAEDSVSSNQIRLFFKLMDKITVNDPSITIKGPSLHEARIYLDLSISTGLKFDVQYPTIEMNFMMQPSTLTEISSSTSVPQQSSMKLYGPGSMAGLAIGMLVVGAILGLLGAYIIYKKVDVSIPYKVTD